MVAFRSILLLFCALALGFSAAFASQNCLLQNACFVLDQSGSINDTEYEQIQKFTTETANAINDITTNTQYCAVAFSMTESTIQSPTTNLDEFTAAINKDRIFRGGTNIFAGLRACSNILQKEDRNGRVLILVTDGFGASGPDPRPAIREANITVLAVGIGPGVNEQFLNETASKPQYFIKTSFTGLNETINGIVKDSCLATPLPPSPDCSPSPSCEISPSPSCEISPSPSCEISPSPSPEISPCEEAASRCDFRFMGSLSVPMFDISGPADKSFTPQIVSKDPKEILGVLNTNNIVPEFVFEDSAEPITDFANQPFTPTSFKPFTVGTGSGIGHQTFHGNQLQVASGKCVRVFFTEYQVLNSQGHVIGNFNNIPRSSNKCVVFLTN